MAFDLYVGTMTRFYRREWENVVQRTSREQGIRYSTIYAGGKPLPPPPADEIRQAVATWCEAISADLQTRGYGPVAWDEDDQRPYFTDRPAWEGYRALLAWAARAEHPDMPLPDEVPHSWVDDPAYAKSVEDDFASRYLTILKPELWIPAEFPFVLDAPTLLSESGAIGSVFTLKQELDELHATSAERFKELRLQKKPPDPQPAIAEKTGFFARLFGSSPKTTPRPEPSLAETAEFALPIFREMAAKACEHRLPLLLHF